MKKFLFILGLFLSLGFFNKAEASHMAGGEIWYEYIGTTAHPHRYQVYLEIYRDVSGIELCYATCTKQVCITSSCFNTINLTVNQIPFTSGNVGGDTTLGIDGSIITPGLTDCVDPNASGLVTTELYLFTAQVDLPGTCSDFTFSFSEGSRNPSTNLVNADYYNFFIQSVLNNTLGPNTSPHFINPAAKSFCVGSPFFWSQVATEPDGDSLYYDFGNPLDGYCGGTGTPLTFTSGYTKTQPMTTIGGITFDHGNGKLSFTPAQPEVDVIDIVVTEYRYTTTYGWLQIGTSVRDLQIPVVTQCDTSSFNGPKFNTSVYGNTALSGDSLNNLSGFGITHISNDSSINSSTGQYNYLVPIIAYDCFDSLVNVKFKKGVYCESVAPDGSDFRIIGPDSIPRPVIAAIDHCKPDLTTNSIDLVLYKPLDVNGDYFLYVKTGSDGNTLTNKCGFSLDPFYLLILRVDNCPILDYKMNNVSVVNDKHIQIDWQADTTTFSPHLFTSWNILRGNDGGPFYTIDNLNDVNVRSYLDSSVDEYAVNHSTYQYAVQMVQNFDFKGPTNNITSILLNGNINTDTTKMALDWNAYNGWDSVMYEVFLGKLDSSSMTMDWQHFDGADSNFFASSYNIPPQSQITANTAGTYAFKVDAYDPNDPDTTYVSESNWVYFQLKYNPIVPPPPTAIPNVFTPNGDGKNDFFKFSSTGYTSVQVNIYNRNGKLVFKDDNFSEHAWDGTDINSGHKVADGTYYYIVKMSNNQGNSKEEKGQLTILSNGTN